MPGAMPGCTYCPRTERGYLFAHGLSRAVQTEVHDPKYQEYTAKIRDAVQEKNRINSKQCMLLREINNLSVALDLTRHGWDFESVEQRQGTRRVHWG